MVWMKAEGKAILIDFTILIDISMNKVAVKKDKHIRNWRFITTKSQPTLLSSASGRSTRDAVD
eukprot:12998007-Ditylum_brightwellii.AAC.1